MRHTLRFALLSVLFLALCGCSDFVDTTQPDSSLGLGGPVADAQTVGQTFVARHGGLNGISILAKVDGPPGDGVAILHLRSDPTQDQDIVQSSLPLAGISNPGFYLFSFPPIPETHGKRYYFVIQAQGLPEGSSLQVGQGPVQAYDDGAMYRSDQPNGKQLAFRLHYDRSNLLLQVILGAVSDIGTMMIALALFVLPGWALLVYLLPPERLNWKTTLGLAGSLSLCVYPLIMLLARVAGAQPGAATAWGPVLAAGIALIARYRPAPRALWPSAKVALQQWACSAGFLPNLAFGGVALAVIAVRLFVIRGYEIPLWGDSVQHAFIGQLMVDHGGLFDSWLPYTPFQTLTVHFGFHSDVAAWHWLVGGDISRNTLVVGQIVNALAIFALAPLATRLLKSEWAGVGALLVAGLLSPMPMEYVNWGRYSQLAGQAVLPGAAWLTWELAEAKSLRRAWQVTLLTGIALAGMFLSYYRMPHYYAAFVVAWLLACGLPRWRLDWKPWSRWAVQLTQSGVVMLALVAFWLAHIAGGNLATSIGTGIIRGSTLEQVQREYEGFRSVELYVPLALQALTVAGMAWGIVRRRSEAVAMGAWLVGLVGLIATRLIRLPGSNHMVSFAIMISLYMPVGLLGGYFLDVMFSALTQRARWGAAAIIAALLVAGGWGAMARSAVIDHAYRIVAPADLAAIEWIRANTPPEALFLVDGFLIYNDQSIVGSDAGWWIPLLAGRQNTMPPQYALLNEKPYTPEYNQAIVDLVLQLRQVGVTSPEGRQLLCQYGITHVYVGQGQGQIALPPPEPMLPIAELEASPHFSLLYRQDKVGVFAFNTQECQ